MFLHLFRSVSLKCLFDKGTSWNDEENSEIVSLNLFVTPFPVHVQAQGVNSLMTVQDRIFSRYFAGTKNIKFLALIRKVFSFTKKK